MCTINDWSRRGGPMDDALYERLAAEIIDHAGHVERVSLYRDGEPLLDPAMPERIRALKQGGVKEVMLSSNVSLLTPDKGEALLRAGLDTMILSVDSLDPETYAEIRVGLDLDTVLRNARKFIALRDRIRPETRIRMRMIRQESNYDEWPAYQRYWADKLSARDRVYFNNINNWGGQLKTFKAVSRSYEPNLPCVALWSLLVVFAGGEVPYCNVDYNNTRPTGNLAGATIAELWRSQTMQDKRRAHLAGRKRENPLCETCNAWDEPPDAQPVSAEYAEAVDI
jgi:hypothetical protein